tara:strand:- start:144 stop:422 length:279 start_codon:yes stop_codon:yes gene_type:complete
MQIQLSQDMYLTSSQRTYELSRKDKHGNIVAFCWFTDLENCFKHYIDYKIRNSKTLQFADLIDLLVQSVKEIKKTVKIMEVQNETDKNKRSI